MKAQLTVLLMGLAGIAHAQGDVYVCVGENGTREYKNTGLTKGCKRVDLPATAMIAAPAPYKKPVAQTAAAKPAASPGDFPRIDSGAQKVRDNDRMQILVDELKAEEKKLATLRQEFNGGEPERRGDERNFAKYQDRVASMKQDLARAEKNIEALKREIANLK
jgi:hypothetical protein